MRTVSVIAASCCVMVLWAAAALGDTLAPVGMRQLEFRDRDRRLSLTVFYPAGVNFLPQHHFWVGIVQALIKLELRVLSRLFDRPDVPWAK